MRNSLSESPIPLNAAKVRKNYYSRKFLCEKMQNLSITDVILYLFTGTVAANTLNHIVYFSRNKTLR